MWVRVPQYYLKQKKNRVGEQRIKMITELKNATPVRNLFYPNPLLLSDGELFQPIKERVMSLSGVTSKQEHTEIVRAGTTNKKGRYFFFVYNTENYYHFVYDTLPYLISFFELRKQYPDIKLLMNYPNESKKERYRFVNEFLSLLGIPESSIELIDGATTYESIFVSDSFTYGENPFSPPDKKIYDLYNVLSSMLEYDPFITPNIIYPKKIYVSRRTHLHNNFSNIGTNYTSRRKMVNEDELVEYLATKGYVEVFPELLTTAEVIAMFGQATHIVGAIGGGLVNTLFSLPSTQVTTIVSPGFLDVNKRFVHCMKHTQLKLFHYTSHTETTDFKRNMRIQCGNIVGEITSMNDDRLNVMYSDQKVAGWNSETKYLTTVLNVKNCKKLDNGLNSPWKVDLQKLKEIV